MITIIYSTHKDKKYNDTFKKHLLDTVGLKNVQILEYQNNNEFSLAQIYNRGINESIFDILVCCHNDIELEKGWGKKILKDFENNQDFGIIGKAGSCYFPSSGIYWEKMQQTMVGQVWHHPNGQKKWINQYSAKIPVIVPVVTIDGLFISFNKNKIKKTFDEQIGKFHFYDHPFCLSNYLSGVKLGVTSSFEIIHQSVGEPNEEFYKSKDSFLQKYGQYLPLDLLPNLPYYLTTKPKSFKNIGKVAIIIPNLNNFEMLQECLISFYENCDEKKFEIFIADTGSDEDNKSKIKQFIETKSNITLIEYSYYNFAKINNDVVKNHLKKEHEFILFCNNDIKILNNVIDNMLNVFKNFVKVGTVGCRLHYEDNRVQHDGHIYFVNKQNQFVFSHFGNLTYYGFTPFMRKVIGNTAALMMVKKESFQQVGFFNENYTACFEDVELNCKFLINGYTNYYDGESVGYHKVSSTRSLDSMMSQKEQFDYNNFLLPFINNNIEKLKNKIYVEPK